MVIYNKHNYLPKYYKTLPSDSISNFLKDNLHHICFEEDFKFIQESKINDLTLDNLCLYIYNRLNKLSFKKSEIEKNIFDINKLQIKKLAEQNFKISFPSTIERPGLIRESYINIRNKKSSKRSLVLYYRGPWRDHKNTACVDVFHLKVIYKVILLFIVNNNFKSFNDIFIVHTDVDREEFNFFKGFNISKKTGSGFIEDTCLFANTIHFNVGELPDIYSHTQPILSRSLIFNDFHLPKIDDQFVFDAIYPEVIFKDRFEYCLDKERSYNNTITSWKEIFDNEQHKNSILKSNSFKNVYKVVENLISVIYNVDNEYSRRIS